jgi:hypothetical protein
MPDTLHHRRNAAKRLVGSPGQLFWAAALLPPALLSLDAALAFASARLSPLVGCGLGLQLPFSPGALPATGSKPGQQRLAACSALCLADDCFVAFFE